MASPKPKPSPSPSGLRVSLGNGRVLDPKTGKITVKPSPIKTKDISSSEYDKILKKVIKDMKSR